MEVHFPPEIEKKLNELAIQSGMTADELVKDAFAGMFDELAETREMLDRRYDEIKSGKVKAARSKRQGQSGKVKAARSSSFPAMK